MKKPIILIPVIAFLFLSCAAYADTPVKKLGRGAANIIFCWLEVPKGIGDANTENGPIAAGTFGVLQGIVKTGIRAGVGVYEVVTFLVPIPPHYAPVLTDPEFFLEEGLF